MDYSNGEWRRTYYICLCNPKSIDTPEYVRTKDSYVQEDISRLEEALAILKQYRLELMERIYRQHLRLAHKTSGGPPRRTGAQGRRLHKCEHR